jgi:hypothetical protein
MKVYSSPTPIQPKPDDLAKVGAIAINSVMSGDFEPTQIKLLLAAISATNASMRQGLAAANFYMRYGVSYGGFTDPNFAPSPPNPGQHQPEEIRTH